MYYTVIKHDGHWDVRKLLKVQEMFGLFYHSVIHGLGFFIWFTIQILNAQNNKTLFFDILYSDKR